MSGAQINRWDARKTQMGGGEGWSTVIARRWSRVLDAVCRCSDCLARGEIRGLLLLSVSHASNPKQCNSPMQCSQSQSWSRALLRPVVIRGEARRGKALIRQDQFSKSVALVHYLEPFSTLFLFCISSAGYPHALPMPFAAV